jgi:peptidoglycan hydrolase-like protein with peptidoglycan-binding domain
MRGDLIAAPIERDHDADLDPARDKRRTGMVWLAFGVVAALGCAAMYWWLARDPVVEPTAEPTGPVATAEVVRATLTSTEAWGGTLGHGSPFTVKAKGGGTITGLAEHGAAAGRGIELYRLDENPVIALIGTVPMYRDLGQGATGADVEQLEANLAKLGYDGFDVDEKFTWYTARAVKQWQADIGAEETGTVAASDVVFVAEIGRVDGITVDPGDIVLPGTEILDITSPEQIVSLDVEVHDRDLVDVGTGVIVRLPGGAEVTGTVTSAVVTEDASDGDAADDEAAGASDTVTKVEVTLDDETDASLLGSPVDVVVNGDQRADVLAVPVTALLALSEGGFGVEVIKPDGTTSIVAVDTGMFADGQVEINGEGIGEGTVVGAAGR